MGKKREKREKKHKIKKIQGRRRGLLFTYI